LHQAGAEVTAYDPIARHEAEKVLDGSVTYGEDLGGTIADAQAIVLMTRWPEFEKLPEHLAALKVQPLVVDGRRMLSKETVARYEGVGT
jgi:UDPglucose 6-dehydrogenase/GDP-mannose 6-dehydrogenase